MAATVTAYIVVESTELGGSPMACPINLGKDLLVSPAKSGGLIYPIVSGTGASIGRFCRITASDLGGGYNSITAGNGFVTTEYTATTGALGPMDEEFVDIQAFSTNSTLMSGLNAENEATTFFIRSYWTASGDDPTEADVIIDIYHRDPAGIETLIHSYTQAITGTSTRYSQSVALYHSWYASNRYVVKARARFVGGPPV